ncbi:MAG: hypothetical protein GVY19_09560 [Bacteroidetes bacterium]|jgi:hypothetical protein|nr:hypothetical protein [Bacteroidota bacterium]
MKVIFYILIFLVSISLNGQENTGKENVNFSSLTLRPNSRDYAPVYMNNHHQRLAYRRAVAISNQKRIEMLKNPDFIRKHQMMRHKSRDVMRKHMQQHKQFKQRQMIRRQIIRQQRIRENRPGRR